jgi:hypothetical protein
MEAEYAKLTKDGEYEAPEAQAAPTGEVGDPAADQIGRVAGAANNDATLRPVDQGLAGVVAPNGVEAAAQSRNVDGGADQVPGSRMAQPADVMAASVADMSGAELRVRARELGVDDRGPISVVRRRVSQAETNANQAPSLPQPTAAVDTQPSPLPRSSTIPAAPSETQSSRSVQTLPVGEVGASSSQNPTPTQDGVPDNYEEAKAMQDRLEADLRFRLDVPRNAVGMASDEVRSTPEYKRELLRTQRAMKRMQDYNTVFVKKFKKERAAEQRARFATPPSAPVPPTPAQAPSPAQSERPATSQQSPTQGESATAATGTVSAGRALDENRSTDDADIADISRNTGNTVSVAQPANDVQRRITKRMAKIGRRVVWVTDASRKFNGAASPRDSRTIYIRSDIDTSELHATIAHELLHGVAKETPDIVRRVVQQVGQGRIAEAVQKYRGRLVASFSEGSAAVKAFDSNEESQAEEGAAQVVEDAGNGNLELAKLLEDDAGLIGAFKAAVRQYMIRAGFQIGNAESRAVMDVFDRAGINGKAAQSRAVDWANTRAGITAEMSRAAADDSVRGKTRMTIAEEIESNPDKYQGMDGSMFAFSGALPLADIKAGIATFPPDVQRAVLKIFRPNVRGGVGSDVMAEFGERYFLEAAALAVGESRAKRLRAVDAAASMQDLKNDPDPNNQLKAAIWQTLEGFKGKPVAKVGIPAQGLRMGDVFRINGQAVRLVQDEDGNPVLIGGPFKGIDPRGLDVIPVDAPGVWTEDSKKALPIIAELTKEDLGRSRGVSAEGPNLSADVPFSPRSMFDRTDETKGTSSQQASLFAIPAQARATEAPKLTLAERRELYPGIKPNETTAQYEKRMGTADTPMMFSPLSPTIDVDGVQRPTTNSNGQPIAQDEASVRNFWRWFKGSTATDRSGRPLVVYHGTPDGRFLKQTGVFQSLKERFGKAQGGGAFWFATSRATASTYANPNRAFDYQNAEPQVVASYIRLENPLMVDAAGQEWRQAQARGRTSDVIEQAQSNGHDGATITNVRDDYNNTKGTRATTTYTVFASNQIKAVDNAGTFDPANPDIRFAPGRGMSRIEQRNQERADRVIARLEKKVDATAAKGEERANELTERMAKRVDTEREKAESAKAAARATISVLQTQLKAAGTREKGLSKVVGILETMRAKQDAAAELRDIDFRNTSNDNRSRFAENTKLQAENRSIKEKYKDDLASEKRVAEARVIAERAKAAEAMAGMKQSQREVEQIKDAVVRAVRDSLPVALHGKFITDIRKVRGAYQLPALLAKIEQASQLNRAKELDKKLSNLTGVRDTRKLDNPKVRDYVVGARGKNGTLKALTDSANTRDVAKKAMRDFVESAKAFMDAKTANQRHMHIVEMENAFGNLAAAVEAQKAEDKLVEKNRMRAISDVANRVVERLASMPVSVIVRVTGEKFGSVANHGILWVTGLDNIGNMIDGLRTDIGGGAFSQTIVRPIQKGQNQSARQVKDAKDLADEAAARNGLGSFAEAFATLFGAMGDANTATYKLTIPIGGKTELRAWEALKLAALDQETLGHVIGLDRPLFWDADGSGFTVSWQQYDAMMKAIPDNHLAFMQDLKAIRDLGFDAMASEVKKLTGTEPPKVFGYDKITVHPDVSAKWNVDKNASLLPTGHITQSLENLGITKARESNKAAMLVTNFGEDWLQTVDTQARVTHLAAPIRNMKELLRRDDVKLAIKSRITPYALERLQTIADDVGGTGTRGGREGSEFTRRLLKYSANKNKALTAMNLSSVARNGAGVMTLLAEMDVRVWTEGIARVMSLRSDSLVDLMDKSDLVSRFYGQSVVALQTIQTQGSMAADAGRDRAGTAWEQFVRGGKATGKSAARAAADLRGLRIPGRRVGAVADFFRGLLDAAGNAGTMLDGINMIHYVSSLPARVAWEGYKAEAARRGESEDWAIQQTERAVGRTQAVPDPAELTALQSFARGTPLQPLTSFGTDAARMVNMILRAKITGNRRGATAAAVVLAGAWSGAVTGLFSKELLNVLFGTDDEEDRRNLWQKIAADAVRDSFGSAIPGVSDRGVEAVKAWLTVRTPGAAESQLLETPVSSGITNFAGGIGLLVSAVDEAIEGDDKKGRTPNEKALKSAEMMLTEMLEASGVPLPSVYRQGKRAVTAATEKKDAKP